MFDAQLADVIRNATAVGATLKFGTIAEGGQVQVAGEPVLEVTPPGLVPQPYEANRTVAILRMGASTLVAGYVGGTTAVQLVPGVDYQTPLVAGTHYQTPLVAGTDYQAPLAAAYTNPWWASQNGWGVLDTSHIYRYGPVVSMVLNMRSPTTSTAIAANGAAVVAYLTNSQVAPPINATFAWRATTGQGGFGEINTAGTIALGSPTAITLAASSSVFFTITFIKP